MPARRAIFLDRDGVLNVPILAGGRSYAPTSVEEFRLYDDAVSSVCRLKQSGYATVVITNQPDVGNGKTPRAAVEKMHEILKAEMPIDRIEVCYDTRETPGNRLKPAPDMILAAAAELGIDLARSAMIGDRAGDMEAAGRAGCGSSIFIDRGYVAEAHPTTQDVTVSSLLDAVDWLLSENRPKSC